MRSKLLWKRKHGLCNCINSYLLPKLVHTCVPPLPHCHIFIEAFPQPGLSYLAFQYIHKETIHLHLSLMDHCKEAKV